MAGGNPYVIYRADGQTFITQPVQVVGPDGVPLGTAENPFNVLGGGGDTTGGAADISDRAARILGHTLIDNLPTDWDVTDRFARLLGHVAVDNWPATQPVSGAVAVSNFPATQPVSGPLTDTQLRAGPIVVQDKTANTLGVSATGAAAAAVTATLPALGAGLFQYIEAIEITMYSTAARTGTATPVVVTSTNLPAAHAWTFPSAGAIGTVTTMLLQPRDPIRAATANQAVTIVCPATAAVIWRVNVFYGAGA